jgi:ankyrin
LGNLEVASTLLDAGADPTIPNSLGITPLMKCTDIDIAERLLNLGVDPRARNVDGMDSLMYACERVDAQMVAFLLEHGVDGYAIANNGMTGLICACREGHTEVVLLLLDEDLEDEVDNYQVVLDWLYADFGIGTAIHWAVQRGHAGCVQALVDHHLNVDVGNHADESTPLHFATDVEVARILLEAGAQDLDRYDGMTPLSIACLDDDDSRLGVLRLLLERFPHSDYGDRPFLHDTAWRTCREAFLILLELRACQIKQRCLTAPSE